MHGFCQIHTSKTEPPEVSSRCAAQGSVCHVWPLYDQGVPHLHCITRCMHCSSIWDGWKMEVDGMVMTPTALGPAVMAACLEPTGAWPLAAAGLRAPCSCQSHSMHTGVVISVLARTLISAVFWWIFVFHAGALSRVLAEYWAEKGRTAKPLHRLGARNLLTMPGLLEKACMADLQA